MKTIVIWSDFEELPKFFVVPEDWSRFDGVVINVDYTDADPECDLEPELNELLYNTEGILYYELQPISKLKDALIEEPDFIISCGFAP